MFLELHGQVGLAAVNQIYVIHEAMNGCKKSKGSLKACFKNVNIHCISLILYLIEMAFNTFANRADPEKYQDLLFLLMNILLDMILHLCA